MPTWQHEILQENYTWGT